MHVLASSARLVPALTLLGVLACSTTTTELTNVWKDPAVSSIHFKRCS
jgi:hypothetical protein